MSLVGSLLAAIGWARRSSTLRLSIVLSAIFAVCLAVAVSIALFVGADVLERRVDTTLRALASASDLQGTRGDTFGVILRAPDDLGGLPRPFARVVERGGGSVELGQDFRQSDTWRVLVAQDMSGVPVMAAVPLDDGEEALELLGDVLWATVLTVMVLTLLVGLATGVFAQRRIARINATLADLAQGNLAARTGHTRAKDDLDDIARQVDLTAGELERLVTQTRNLSASLAHDLRTPLARLQSRLEALPDGDARGAALEEASRLSSIFDTIMRVARIEAGQGTEGSETVDLAALVEDLGEIFGPVIEDEGKTLRFSVQPSGSTFADKQMLVQVMANLIQNALRHGGPEITLIAQNGAIGVADNGQGVEPSDFDEILKPMVRLDAARRTEGSGLGLALVRAVADRHGADLRLEQNNPQGLRVLLKFADL